MRLPVHEVRRALVFSLLCASGPAAAAGATAGWGDNDFGSLGDGTFGTVRRSPAALSDPGNLLSGKTIVQISSGGLHTCALTADGDAFCWGDNRNGRLGNGAADPASATPVAVDKTGVLAGKTIIQISAGDSHSCALTSDGRVYCWGANDFGQLGVGLAPEARTPVAVASDGLPLGKTVIQISAGQFYTCALTTDGGAACWGRDEGQFGNGGVGQSVFPRVAFDRSGVLSGKTITQISAGYVHLCAVTSDGGAYCWGRNDSGQLGDGSNSFRPRPVAVDKSGVLAGKSITQISAGEAHTCALTSDGGAYCWGSGENGRLGNFDNVAPRFSPIAVGTAWLFGHISVGSRHSCALTFDGRGYCWGDNTGGQVGDGSNAAERLEPVAVDASGVLADKFVWQVDGGSFHTVATAPACGPGIDISSGRNAQWHAFSLPLTATARPATVAAVLGSGTPTNLDTAQYNIANPAAGTGWVIFRRDPATNQYVRLAATDRLNPLVGYWIKSFQKTRTGKLFVDCTGAAPSVSTSPDCASARGCFGVPLNTTQAGLKLLGNPYPWRIDWSKARIRVSDNGVRTVYTPAQAAGFAASGNASPPVLGNTFWVWNSASYDSFSDFEMAPGSLPYLKSFWVELLPGGLGKSVDLLIPIDPTTLAQ